MFLRPTPSIWIACDLRKTRRSNNDSAIASHCPMPTFRRLFPGEIELEPPIFLLTIVSSDESVPVPWEELLEIRRTEIATRVTEGGGSVYLSSSNAVFFGFPQLIRATAIDYAGLVLERMNGRFPGENMLSISTVGLSEHSHIHAHMVEHIGDPQIVDVLNARIKFLDYESYVRAVEKLRES